MISCQVCWRTMRWHNGQIRRSLNPQPSKVSQDWTNKWEESVAHSIVARSYFPPMKAVYICADQPCPLIFRLQFGGGPYMDGWPTIRTEPKFDVSPRHFWAHIRLARVSINLATPEPRRVQRTAAAPGSSHFFA